MYISLPRAILSNPIYSGLLPLVLGSAIGWSTRPRSDTQCTYGRLAQPPLSPPAWVFGPVWTLLYMGMGYASHLAYLRDPSGSWRNLYSVQLLLNFIWMPLFFGMGEAAVALVDLVGLTGLVGVLCSRWWGRTEGWLMVPYVLWCGFASYLNAGVGIRNGWRFNARTGGKRE